MGGKSTALFLCSLLLLSFTAGCTSDDGNSQSTASSSNATQLTLALSEPIPCNLVQEPIVVSVNNIDRFSPDYDCGNSDDDIDFLAILTVKEGDEVVVKSGELLFCIIPVESGVIAFEYGLGCDVNITPNCPTKSSDLTNGGVYGPYSERVNQPLLSDILYYLKPHESDLIKSYSTLSNCDLSYFDLSDLDLSMADLSNSNLTGSNLMGANLSNANLSNSKPIHIWGCPKTLPVGWGCFHTGGGRTYNYGGQAGERTLPIRYTLFGPSVNLSYIEFNGDIPISGVNLTGADFSFVEDSYFNFENTVFSEIVLEGFDGCIHFESSSLSNISLDEVICVSGTELNCGPDVSIHYNLSRCLTTPENRGVIFGFGQDLSGLNLSGMDLTRLDLNGADFSNSNLSNVRFCNSQACSGLEKVIFDYANLSGVALGDPDWSNNSHGYNSYFGMYNAWYDGLDSYFEPGFHIDAYTWYNGNDPLWLEDGIGSAKNLESCPDYVWYDLQYDSGYVCDDYTISFITE